MLYGKYIRLCALERTHLPNFVCWFNDPEVRQYLAWDRPMSSIAEERWFENTLDAASDFRFAIEAVQGCNWRHIGSVGLESIDWQSRSAVFGIMIGDKEYWGRGAGTDAARTMLRFGFETLNLHRVQLDVFEFNSRAIRCYEKLGFRYEGTKRQALFRGGRYHDVLLMSILSDEVRFS